MKNFIIRTITGIIFVAAIVSCFLRPEAMVLLFSIITGLTVWEFTGLVNEREDVTVNRFISTVAGVYFFYAMTYYCSDMYAGIAKSVVFIPYLVTIVYLLVAELYLKQNTVWARCWVATSCSHASLQESRGREALVVLSSCWLQPMPSATS